MSLRAPSAARGDESSRSRADSPMPRGASARMSLWSTLETGRVPMPKPLDQTWPSCERSAARTEMDASTTSHLPRLIRTAAGAQGLFKSACRYEEVKAAKTAASRSTGVFASQNEESERRSRRAVCCRSPAARRVAGITFAGAALSPAGSTDPCAASLGRCGTFTFARGSPSPGNRLRLRFRRHPQRWGW